MRQPIKFLPYLKTADWGGEEISWFKGLKINCKNIGESWELSGVAGCESIVMDGDDCGMTLPDMVAKYRERLVGESVYSRYGDTFPLVVKFVDAGEELSVHVSAHEEAGGVDADARSYGCRYCPTTGALAAGRLQRGVAGNHDIPAGGEAPASASGVYSEISGVSSKTSGVSSETSGVFSETSGVFSETEELMSCERMQVQKELVKGERRLTNRHDSFMGLVCVGGNGSLRVDGISTSVKQGDTLLIPARTEEFDVEGTMALLTVVIPTLMAGAEV